MHDDVIKHPEKGDQNRKSICNHLDCFSYSPDYKYYMSKLENWEGLMICL